MTRRAPLPKITECVDIQTAEAGLSRCTLLKACFPFAVVCGLCLAHVHLQFVRADMLMQASQLQGEQRVLQRRLAVLERQSNAVDIEELKIRGKREMAMQEVESPTGDLLARIPLSIQKKYEMPLGAGTDSVMVAQMQEKNARGVAAIKNALFSLFETGRAVASVSERQR